MTVFVSGCFDIIHGGHIEFFTQARHLGERLVVCAPTDAVYMAHKQREPLMPFEHRIAVLSALRMVDEVVVGADPEIGLNFKTQFHRISPAILAVTDDDCYEEAKRALCAAVGAQYCKLPKSLPYAPVTSSDLINGIRVGTRTR